jgi:hypothetical protein
MVHAQRAGRHPAAPSWILMKVVRICNCPTMMVELMKREAPLFAASE